jgi:hypothetical protein
MSDELASIARKLIAEAKIQECPNAYSATGHSTNNISIIHQQVRCINLAWALVNLRKVKHGSVVAIVGDCFSGLMLAVSLAVQRRCIVYIYEKEALPLQRFRRSPYRFISTNLNSRDLPPRYQPKYSRPIYDLPIFAWVEGTASEVAHRWLREFQDYYVRLPIFLRTDHEITACLPNGSGVMLQVGDLHGRPQDRRTGEPVREPCAVAARGCSVRPVTGAECYGPVARISLDFASIPTSPEAR